MSEDKPKTPSPRVYRDGAVDRIIPISQAIDVTPAALASWQADALELVDSLRDRIMDGEIVGLSIAGVSLLDGYPCISSAWSSGFIGMGITGSAAIAQLNHRFQSEFYETSA